MLVQQRDDSDGPMDSMDIPKSSITAASSLKALLYKSTKIQQRNYCSNICQILTPLLCVAFTLVVKVISTSIVTSRVEMPTFPRPFDLPIMYEMLPFNLSCKQIYLYTHDGSKNTTKFVNEMFAKNLKRYCLQTSSLTPIFTYKTTQQLHPYMISLLNDAEKQPYLHGKDMETPLADGTMVFNNISSKRLDMTVSVNDYRLSEYHRNNGVSKLSLSLGASIMSYVMTTQGLMTVIQKITRPFLQSINRQKQIIFGSYMYMPFDGQDRALIDKTINVIGAGLYPLGLSLLLPLFLYAIVSQKQQKLIEIMRMNGLKLKYYWICTFIFNFLLSMITFAIFYIFGAFVLDLSFFTTSSLLLWVVFIGWGIAQISMTNLVQIFIRNGKSATIIGYILSIFSTLLGETISVAVYADPLRMPTSLLLYPPFALCRIIYHIGIACSSTGCYRNISDINEESVTIIVILYLWFLMFLLSVWLDGRVQQEFGVGKGLGFMRKISEWRGKNETRDSLEMKSDLEMADQEIKTNNKSKIDSSVHMMRQSVARMRKSDKNLIIKDLSKKYETSNGKNNYTALKPFSLSIESNQIFGLLGPNGAGKTTLISVLTGMYPKSSGNAWINGVQVGEGEANEFIGVCPQFDLLWENLTVYEHLKFYAILKGIPSSLMEQKIQESIRDVDLQEWTNTQSHELSGGMQRRLSIAIALVGNPTVVFLDEPSSGLDPSHRRKMWNILQRCKNKTSIVLTTHLMEQAEALCDRIGIISEGELRCIGKTKQLKQLFGQGYRLHINFLHLLSEQNGLIITQLVQKFGAKIVNSLDSRVVLKVEKDRVLECVKWVKKQESVNWMVSQPSLYDVFMCFVQ